MIKIKDEINKIEYRNINVHWSRTGALDEKVTVEARRDGII